MRGTGERKKWRELSASDKKKRVLLILFVVFFLVFDTYKGVIPWKAVQWLRNPLHVKTVERTIRLTEEGKIPFQYDSGMLWLPLDEEGLNNLFTDIEDIGLWHFNVYEEEGDFSKVRITFEAPFVRFRNMDGRNLRLYYPYISKIEVNCAWDTLQFMQRQEYLLSEKGES